ncbi:hypothetical protein [Rhodopirellula baltica]|uniref:Uncharacterized protein n=1 Tax=Rhodopirellula baltica SWK14 TaxID=993516 RepID=L7CE24_RHOBT|nr:hypothetical protein [Rhodopirellula baltica]ELP32095.1 hypothetical protein RBSWK_03794 [Rhodopirellula baltica SWK14]
MTPADELSSEREEDFPTVPPVAINVSIGADEMQMACKRCTAEPDPDS